MQGIGLTIEDSGATGPGGAATDLDQPLLEDHGGRRPPQVDVVTRRKADAVMRLLRGCDLGDVSQEIGVDPHRLVEWRDQFVTAGLDGLKRCGRHRAIVPLRCL